MKPLDGITVIALEQAVAAPLATCRLADAGARVIKIERAAGDFARGYDSVVHGEASYFVWLNRGKESIVLDLKDADDLAFMEQLLAQADVFVQNLAPGGTDRLGIGSDALRARYPRLITCDVSGYGDGDYSYMKAYDLLVQCESGIVAVSGGENELGRVGVSICDIGTGINAFGGIMQALFLRERTGKGSSVEVSLFGTAAEWMQVPLAHHDFGGKAPSRVGLNHPSIAPYGGYKTKDDETVVISIQNNREWAKFAADILERPELADEPLFATNNARVANRPQMNEIITDVFSRYDRADLLPKLRTVGIAYGSVNSVADLSEHPALRRRTMSVNGKEAHLVAPAITTDTNDETYAPVPSIGEHTEQIRKEFKTHC